MGFFFVLSSMSPIFADEVETTEDNPIVVEDVANQDNSLDQQDIPIEEQDDSRQDIMEPTYVEIHYHIVDQQGQVEVEDAVEPHYLVRHWLFDPYYSTIPERESMIQYNDMNASLVDEQTNPHPYTDGDPEQGFVGLRDRIVNYYYMMELYGVIDDFDEIEGELDFPDTIDFEWQEEEQEIKGAYRAMEIELEEKDIETIQVQPLEVSSTNVYRYNEPAPLTYIEQGVEESKSEQVVDPISDTNNFIQPKSETTTLDSAAAGALMAGTIVTLGGYALFKFKYVKDILRHLFKI